MPIVERSGTPQRQSQRPGNPGRSASRIPVEPPPEKILAAGEVWYPEKTLSAWAEGVVALAALAC